MLISYNKLWKLLIDKGISKSELKTAVKMSPNTLAKLGKNEPVSMDVLIRICETIFYKGIMPSEKVLDFPVDCNTLAGSVNL